MLHIPDDRLHAYLDQALDRLDSGALESHLAECGACRAERDAISALRDRTTALLARAASRRTAGPPFASIRARSDERRRIRQRRRQRAAWAASIVAALGAGWGASWYAHERGPRPPINTPLVTVAPAQPASPAPRANAAPAAMLATGPAVQPSATDAGVPTTAAKPAPARLIHGHPAQPKARAAHSKAELATVGRIPKDAQLENGGVWRTVSWDGAKQAAAGDAPPRIDGLPVVEVQVRGGDSSNRPLMVVAQQLASGEVIRSIEGPAADVSALLGTRPSYVSGESAAAAVPTAGEPPAALGAALALRRGNRMVAVTGSVSRDSLKAMMQRLNLMKR
jgi:anti-sigma factor RsiW